MNERRIFKDAQETANWILETSGNQLSLALPLGLGKPNALFNAVYERVKKNPQKTLKIFTALSLEIPQATSDLQRRFLDPFKKRHFGEFYPELGYGVDLREGRLPSNVEVSEFYFQAGKALSRFPLQRNYISLNYTHVAQEVARREIEWLLCLIAKDPATGKYSLSCNPDLTLDLADLYRAQGKKLRIVGVVHPELPFFGGDAEVDGDFFEAILERDFTSVGASPGLFALPREPVSAADFMIGLQASLLVEDGGTIQVGIGSLSDALVYCLCLRQQHPEIYRTITNRLISERFADSKHLHEFHQGVFEKGLYATSEMVMDAFMHLRRAGVLKREVKDRDDPIPRYLHGAFFLGSKEFYQWLRDRKKEGDQGLAMTRVSKVNDLYDPHETAIRRQRVKARFFNMCMEMTLMGGAASDTLPNGQVMSGVGGQFNFVTMSHELPDSHSVLLSKSFRRSGAKKVSNLVWGHDQLTIPRHLRDVFITEYGIAFTRGQTDESVIRSMLSLGDGDFQEALRKKAVKNGKLSRDYEIPPENRGQSSKKISDFFEPYRRQGFFPTFPFGSDFTPEEERLVQALLKLKEASARPWKLFPLWWKGMRADIGKFEKEVRRMDFDSPRGLKARLEKTLLLGVLVSSK